MIKAVTFQATQNFKANLYALEVKSRFIDQTKANGFYKGYGNELSHTVSGTSAIIINSGALLVQGRAIEIVSSESVGVVFENGKVGYIVARIETKPDDNVSNCTLVAKTGATLSGITLTQQDVYQYSAESLNKVYELPLYSFAMQNNAITNVVKLITAIEEITTIKQMAESAATTATNAKNTADTAAANIATINERLENLGFKSGSIYTSSSLTGTPVGNIYRQGNYVWINFNITDTFFEHPRVYITPNEGLTCDMFLPKNFNQQYVLFNIGDVQNGVELHLSHDTNNNYLIIEAVSFSQLTNLRFGNFGYEANPIT